MTYCAGSGHNKTNLNCVSGLDSILSLTNSNYGKSIANHAHGDVGTVISMKT